MLVIHIFTGDDGRSHFEDLDVPLSPHGYGALSERMPVTTLRLRETPADGFVDFHRAPQRQFVITLSGLVEVECGDGSKRRLGPGDIMLADDTTGQGHTTREIEGPRRSLFLPLDPDFDVTRWRS